jgi:iron(III) transport system substrate-binding protein
MTISWLKLLAGMLLALVVHAAAAQELTVYSALEADQIKAYQAAFEKANPGIKLRWVRDSTGIVTAKLLAEKANPQADVVFGLAATSLMLLDKEGMLAGYAPQGLDKIKKNMRDPANPPKWVGMDIWASAICFNTIESAKRSLAAPVSWSDLVKPAYKGQIAMPNPASSGTGYLMVAGWLQMMGEDNGWRFMDALHQNISSYTHSGSKPCRQAAAGEYAIGLSFEYRANKTRKDGGPIEAILPKEGLGWDMEAAAIMNSTKKMAAARKLLDWSVTAEANELYAQNFAIVALPGVQAKLEHIRGDVEQMLGKNDFGWAAANRERILTEWTKRYDGKSEKK